MFKKLVVAVSLFSALMVGQEASAARSYRQPMSPGGHWYGSLFGGGNWLQMSEISGDYSAKAFEPGYQLGLTFGYQMASPFRVEAEFSYRQNSLRHIEYLQTTHYCHLNARTWAYMGNMFVDLDCGVAKPYLGVGLGYARTDGTDNIEDAAIALKDYGLAWQALAGIAIPFTENLDLDIGYRCFMAKRHYRDHSLNVGLRQAF